MMNDGRENRKSESEDPLRIWIMMERYPKSESELSHCFYILDLSSDADAQNPLHPKVISPSMKLRGEDLEGPSTMAKSGSKLVVFAGRTPRQPWKKRVFVIDTEEKQTPCLRAAATMKYPKTEPCVFTADGMIYVLSTFGEFERYSASLNKWEKLPRARRLLLDLVVWGSTETDCATVVGRNVFIGLSSGEGRDRGKGMCMTFNLDTLEWGPDLVPAPFPCASLSVNGSFYRLRGHDVWLTATGVDLLPGNRKSRVMGCLDIVKTNFDGSNIQVMAPPSDLDDALFIGNDYHPWRQLLHLHANFFCYVVTLNAIRRGCSVFVIVFEEVFEEATTNNNNNLNNKSHFRSLATFSYQFASLFPLPNFAQSIHCCTSGTVPHSWIKGTHKDKLKPGILPVHIGYRSPEQIRNIIPAEDANVSELRAELARKDELVKTLLAERAMLGPLPNYYANIKGDEGLLAE